MGFTWSPHDRSVGAGFLRIAGEQMAKAVLEAGDVDVSAEERVHAARVRCKKLRALFRLASPSLAEFRRADRAVRDAAACLSAARDARVLHTTLAGLGLATAPPPAPHEATADERKALRRFRRRLVALACDVDAWPVGAISAEMLARGAARTYRDCIHDETVALATPDAAVFHAWRKVAKYHAIQLDLLRPIAPAGLTPATRRAERLADLLGQHHDLAVLEQVALTEPARLGHGVDLAAVCRLAAERQAKLAHDAHALAAEMFLEAPRAFRWRVLGIWQHWREVPAVTAGAGA